MITGGLVRILGGVVRSGVFLPKKNTLLHAPGGVKESLSQVYFVNMAWRQGQSFVAALFDFLVGASVVL